MRILFMKLHILLGPYFSCADRLARRHVRTFNGRYWFNHLAAFAVIDYFVHYFIDAVHAAFFSDFLALFRKKNEKY